MSEARDLARRQRDFAKECRTDCTLWEKSGNAYVQYAAGQYISVAAPAASNNPYLSPAAREALTLPQGRVGFMPIDSPVKAEDQVRTATDKYRVVTVYRDYMLQEGLSLSLEKIK